MSRPLDELIQEYNADPTQWELIRTETTASTTREHITGAPPKGRRSWKKSPIEFVSLLRAVCWRHETGIPGSRFLI